MGGFDLRAFEMRPDRTGSRFADAAAIGKNGGMSDQPINAAALRGALDLSGLGQRPAPASGGSTPDSGVVIDVTSEQEFAALVSASVRYPVLVTLFATSQPGSRTPVDELAAAVRAQDGRVQLAVVDIDVVPEIGQAFAQLAQQVAQQGQLPPGSSVTTVAFVQGQPMPLPPLQDAAMARQIVDEIVKLAIANGITGRVPGADAAAAEDEDSPGSGEGADGEDELPPLHQEAYDALERGDLDAAVAAYEKAIAADPGDEEAKLALGQTKLMKRTEGVDLNAAREQAAAHPDDVQAQTVVADLDVLGGHVDDAFDRLIDLVKRSAGDERNAAREHLVGLFDLVGPADDRVKKARQRLMSALY